ncbi:multidrug resistance-associated protein 1-like [Ixodes scapularis]
MIGVDTMMVSFGIIQIPMPLAGIICSPLIFFMLSVRVGVGPTVSCATWLLFVLLLPFPTSRIQNAQWMTIILFGTSAVMNPKLILNPEISFPCVYMLSMTDMITNPASLGLRMISLALLSMRRIKDFCNAEEQENRQACSKNHTQRKGAVALENCSFAWTNAQGPKPKAVLCGISMDVQPGALVGITGLVGSGKSSLLAAILGDMHRLDGTVNITGETLSGGQKQRISLARAAYSYSQIYLLDDPLSALDQTVADKVFEQVLGSCGLLKDTSWLTCWTTYWRLPLLTAPTTTSSGRFPLGRWSLEASRLQQLLSPEELGGRQPSQRLHRMRELLCEQASDASNPILRELFL